MDLIFVHGRDQQGKNPQALQAQWEAALMEGWHKQGLSRPCNLNVVLPFYGDELARRVQDLNTPLVTDVMTKGAAQDTREAEFRGALLEELASNAGLEDQDIQAVYPDRVLEKGPLTWEWVQAILRALDDTPFGGAAIDLFTRDVYLYLTNRAVRRAIDQIVAAAFVGRECVVVGHSLGTVVSYNVLRTLGPHSHAKRFVTLGSPLGVRAIQRLLVPPALAMPDGLAHWSNAYDNRDVVALRPLDADTLPITPAVRQNAIVRNHTKNRHGIDGYLDDSEVARWVHEALTA